MTKRRRSARRRAALRNALPATALAVATIPLLSGSSEATGFSNPNAIMIPAPQPPPGCPTLPGPNNSCPSTPARLYPSVITVSGVTGTITHATVTLRDLKHDSPSNLDIVVQAPSGKTVMLMDDTCGSEPNTDPITSPITLTFDDDASQGLPLDTACTSGTFHAVNDEDDPHELPFTAPDNFPAPAPPPSTSITLSTFNGDDPNGAWKLWVVDDYPTDPGPDRGGFGGGWSLSLTTTAGASSSSSTPSSSSSSSSSTSSTSSTSTSSTTTTTLGSSSGSSSTTTTTTTTALAPAAATAAFTAQAPAGSSSGATSSGSTSQTSLGLARTGSNDARLALAALSFLLQGLILVRSARMLRPRTRPW